MSPPVNHLGDEGLQVRKCQQGNPEALAALREKYHPPLEKILLSRGASLTETQDLLADLWGDCIPGAPERPSLLEKFSGRCSLQGWLATVATHRWLDLKRRQARRGELNSPETAESSPLENLPEPQPLLPEDSLVQLLSDCLRIAFAQSPPEAMVCLRLVYLHGLTQREIVRMLAWSESKVSRFLSEALEQIQRETLRQLRQRDPWLDLSWSDFVELCQTRQTGFL